LKRRDFFSLAFKLLSLLWGAGFSGSILAFLRTPKKERPFPIPTLPVDEIPVGKKRLIRTPKGPILLVRLEENRFVALSAICTHKRCILDWDEEAKVIVCPCHRATFDISGNVISGPAPSPLSRYRVSVRAGKVYIRSRA